MSIHWDKETIKEFDVYLRKSGVRIVEAKEKGVMNGGFMFKVDCSGVGKDFDLEQQMIDFVNWWSVNCGQGTSIQTYKIKL